MEIIAKRVGGSPYHNVEVLDLCGQYLAAQRNKEDAGDDMEYHAGWEAEEAETRDLLGQIMTERPFLCLREGSSYEDGTAILEELKASAKDPYSFNARLLAWVQNVLCGMIMEAEFESYLPD